MQWDPESRFLTIHMSGTGGLYPYALGVGGALQDHVDMDRVRFVTSSGSGTSQMACIADLPCKDTLMVWERRKKAFVNKYGVLKILTSTHAEMLRAHTQNCAAYGNKKLMSERRNNQRVWVSSVKEQKRFLVGPFVSNADWIDSLFVSALFVPFPKHEFSQGSLKTWNEAHRLGNCMDGEKPCTREVQEDPTHGSLMRFPLPGTRSKRLKSWFRKTYLIVAGLFGDHSYTYDDGYQDAMKHLVPFCTALAPRQPSSTQTHSSDPTHPIARAPINYDASTGAFYHDSSDVLPSPGVGVRLSRFNSLKSLSRLKSGAQASGHAFPSLILLPSAFCGAVSVPLRVPQHEEVP